MNITFATKDDTAEIIRLWQSAFGDDEDYILHFLDYAFAKTQILLLKNNDNLLSMLTLIPANMKSRQEDLPTYYIYAVATDENYRGRGFCRKLLSFAEDMAKEQNISALFLITETDDLINFYEKLGFSICKNLNILMKNKDTEYIYKPKFDDVGNIYANTMVRWLTPACNVLEIVIEAKLSTITKF